MRDVGRASFGIKNVFKIRKPRHSMPTFVLVSFLYMQFYILYFSIKNYFIVSYWSHTLIWISFVNKIDCFLILCVCALLCFRALTFWNSYMRSLWSVCSYTVCIFFSMWGDFVCFVSPSSSRTYNSAWFRMDLDTYLWMNNDWMKATMTLRLSETLGGSLEEAWWPASGDLI